MSTSNATEARFPIVPLTAMSFAAFVYVTFEMFAVGLIRPMARDLDVSESRIGLLMTVYASVVAIVTIPAMMWLARFNKRTIFLITLGFLAMRHCDSGADRQLRNAGCRPHHRGANPRCLLGAGGPDGRAHVTGEYGQGRGCCLRRFHNGIGGRIAAGNLDW